MGVEIAIFDLLLEPRSEGVPHGHYLGSALRGAFGRCLKRTVCIVPQGECAHCPLQTHCPYVYLFETPGEGRPSPFGLETAPHPFVICPPGPLEPETIPLEVRLVLIGRAVSFLPHVLWSFHRLCQVGLGAERRRYALASVVARTESGPCPIWSPGDPTIHLSGFHAQKLEPGATPLGEVSSVRLSFVTPLRIRHERRLCTRLTFPILMTNILRRLYLLEQYHGDGKWELDHRALIAAADEVQCLEYRLRWYDWTRYSSRQETKMQLGGLIGTVTFAGKLGPFLPFLKAAELVHVGRNTSFGLGRMVIQEIS